MSEIRGVGLPWVGRYRYSFGWCIQEDHSCLKLNSREGYLECGDGKRHTGGFGQGRIEKSDAGSSNKLPS